MRLLPPALCLILIATAHANPPATTRSTSRPATTQATDPALERAFAQVEKTWDVVLPKKVRDGKQQPTDEQKALMYFVWLKMATTAKTPERIKEAEDNRRKGQQRVVAIEKAVEETRARVATKPQPLRDEAEKAAAAQLQAARLVNQITDSLITADVTDEQIAQRMIAYLRDLPTTLRNASRAGNDAEYHAQRLKLLETLHDLRHQAATQPTTQPSRKQLDQHIAAPPALLESLDATYQDQSSLLEITPLGYLNNSMLE